MRHQHRQYVHQWICIRDIIDGLITYNHTLKNKNIHEVLNKIDLWLKQKYESKINQISIIEIASIKLFKAKARQLIWDLMEMKYF
jgi:GTPase involved in cell partitioning and DNA repair